MKDKLKAILNFNNQKIDASIINSEQISHIVKNLTELLQKNIEGDVVELGCYVGESSKYIRKTLDVFNSDKQLTVFDSFEGLPPLSEYEKNTGWKPATLKTTEDVLISNFENNNLTPPKVVKGWFKDIKEEDLPEKICFAFLDGDFYDSIYDSLVKIYDRMVDGGIILFHDFRRFDLPGVDAAIKTFFKEKNIPYNLEVVCGQLGRHIVNGPVPVTKNKKITLVTGLWDIGRDSLKEGWSRSYEHYLNKLSDLLNVDCNLIIFGDENLEKFVFNKREPDNTQFILRDISWFKNNEFYDQIQNIRKNPNWYNLAGWLGDSTQAKLELYNPLVMSKMFLLNDARILDKFNSESLYWIDAGLSNTVSMNYFTHDNVLDKVEKFDKFFFVCFPYQANNEIHGFEYSKMNDYTNQKIDKVARGGFFGGPKKTIEILNTMYYSLMQDTLGKGLMGTEESLFTILLYNNPTLIDYFEILPDGLLYTFFENLKSDNAVLKNASKVKVLNNNTNGEVGLYVITFNSPEQFEFLLKSMDDYDENILLKTKKFLLNNSTDPNTYSRYQSLCDRYGFEHIKKDNIGITGGRVFVAEHFDQSNMSYYMFFEDDMSFYSGRKGTCKNGFNRYVENFYNKMFSIMKKENLDFLKFNYTEFYGSHEKQWAWYNVPQNFRSKHWPQNQKLPTQGQDANSPSLKFENIKSVEGVPYATGEIYLSNWPIIMSKEGNYKCYLETKFANPYEQTLMSHCYQETVKGRIKSAVLLMTPTEHNRFDFYAAELRKEC